MFSKALHLIVKIEYLILAILVAVFYIKVGEFDWYWLPLLFLVFDISMVGYLVNPRVGAFLYNAGHSIVGPGLLATAYILSDYRALLFIATLWLFHIFVDRALGYGLKHSSNFKHTHLTPPSKMKTASR